VIAGHSERRRLFAESVRSVVANRSAEQAMRTRVLYPGSVLPENASTLLEIEGVDGLLVGEASVEVDRFAAIVDAASCCRERSRPSARKIVLRGRPRVVSSGHARALTRAVGACLDLDPPRTHRLRLGDAQRQHAL
jgi:hypothetical protein